MNVLIFLVVTLQNVFGIVTIPPNLCAISQPQTDLPIACEGV
jgi:hypothetical protein